MPAGISNPYLAPPPAPRLGASKGNPVAKNPVGVNPMAALANVGGRQSSGPAEGYAGSAGTASAAAAPAPQGEAGGYGTVSAQPMEQSKVPPITVMAGAGPYNAAAASLFRKNRARGMWLGDEAANQAGMDEYQRFNEFSERNSAEGITRLRDELDRKIRGEINSREDALDRTAYDRSEQARAGARNEAVADRNAAQAYSEKMALLDAGAFGRYSEAGMGTDPSRPDMRALEAFGAGQNRMPVTGGRGFAMPQGPRQGQYDSYFTDAHGNRMVSGENKTAAQRYWEDKRRNDLAGEELALARAQWELGENKMGRGTPGGSSSGSRSNGGSGDGRATYDPSTYNSVINNMEAGLSAPKDIEMPAAPAPVEKLTSPELNDSAAFGRARSRIGQASTAAMRSLQDAMTARGISGTGVEGRLMGDLYGEGLGAVGEASRDAAIEQTERDQDVADTNYAGGLTQRGQDLGYVNSTLQSRMQNQQAQNQFALARLAQRGQYAGLMVKNPQGEILRY
jgi:hypothetical protein